MSPSGQPLFPPRAERGYDAAGIEPFPWPVIAGYEDVHRWMDQGQAVHAAWQLRDVWEGLIKFLATLAAADHLASAAAEDSRTGPLIALLLNDRGLSLGHWTALMEMALKDGPLPQARLPQLGPLLFTRGKPARLFRLFTGDKESFIPWRNTCFGHGVFRKDLGSYAEDALRWLDRLHDAFDLCRLLLESLALESDGPSGEILTWGQQSPLPFYHAHQPAPAGPLLPPVRVRLSGSEAIPLTPLLSVQRCGVCGQWAAFYLDRYDPARHRARFLDFVEGHSNEHKNLEPLRRWTERISEADAQATAAREPDPSDRREPDPERFRDFQHEFEPPVYLARQVADFLHAHDCGVLLLTGPGGVGKSWATLGLDHAGMLPAVLGRAVPLLHVSLHGPTAPRASEVWTALAEHARRVKRWQVPAWPDGPDPHTRFAAWLAALMRANGLGELVVALDGLDDLPADSDVPDLWPPAGALPPGCYLVLSSRPGMRAAAEYGLRRVRTMPEHFCELRVGPEEPEHRAILRSYVAKRLARPRPDGQGALPAAWAEPLIDQAGGSFLYVFHYCRALHFGIYADLAQLPSPSTYYPAFFEHLRGRVGDELFEGHYARVLALIAVAREPVGLTHLEAWGQERSRLVVMLDDLADLLRTRREPWDTETLYTLGHDAIRQFLTEDAAWQARLAEANRFLAGLAVQRFGNDWSAVDPFDRVESYLLFHLLDHATSPELRERLLADTALANACLAYGHVLLMTTQLPSSLVAYDLALRLLEDQVQQQGRRELRHVLAGGHMMRGVACSKLGRLEDALDEFGITIRLFRELVECEGRLESRNDLAAAYINRGNALRELGRLEEALTSCSAGISLYELVQSEDRDLRNELAQAYTNRGSALRELGRLDDALADHNRAIGLYEELTHAESCDVLLHQLVLAYMNRGTAWAELGRQLEAINDYSIAIGLCEGRGGLRDIMARAYLNRSTSFVDADRLEEALADCGKCIDLLEDLVRREGRSELRSELALAHLNRGLALGRLGCRVECLSEYGMGIDSLDMLVQREGRRELRHKLAMGYLNRGNDLVALERVQEALADFGKCISLVEELVRCEGRSDLRNSLAHAYVNRGRTLVYIGCHEEAQDDYGASISLFAELHHEGREEVRKDLAIAFMLRGTELWELRCLEVALADFCHCIRLFDELIHQGCSDLRPDLATAFMYRGLTLGRLDRPEEALGDFSASLTVQEELVETEDRDDLRNELAGAYLNRGTALAHLGRLAEALPDYEAATRLLENLVHRESQRGLIGDLARGYAGQAELLIQLGRREDACRRAQQAVSILQSELTRTGRAELRHMLALAEEVARLAGGE